MSPFFRDPDFPGPDVRYHWGEMGPFRWLWTQNRPNPPNGRARRDHVGLLKVFPNTESTKKELKTWFWSDCCVSCDFFAFRIPNGTGHKFLITVENRKINRLSHRFLIGRPIQIAKYDAKMTKNPENRQNRDFWATSLYPSWKSAILILFCVFFAKNKKS